MNGTKVIFFDEDCLLCNRSVQFIIRRDTQRVFSFAKLTGSLAEELRQDFPHLRGYDSLILRDDASVFVESTAALKIARQLKGLWPVLSIFLILPKFLRDPLYRFIAKNRYRWFGKVESCNMVKPEDKCRFLD